MKSACRSLAAASLLLIGASAAHAADRQWVEVRSPHFTVASDAGEKEARNTAWQLEQLRVAMQAICPWASADIDRPVQVLAVRNEDELKALAPQYWEVKDRARPGSVSVSGPDRHFIALRADIHPNSQGDVNPYVNAYWSYAAILIQAGLKRPLPYWFQRGFAEVLSNTIVRDSYIEVGRTIPWHLQRLRTDFHLTVPEMLAVDRNSLWTTQADKVPIFDAQAWAFMHFLLFGDAGKHRTELDAFLTALLGGQTPAAAFQAGFKDGKEIEQTYNAYLRRAIFQFGRMNLDVNVKPDGFVTRTLPLPESTALQAAFLASLRRPVEARALLKQAETAGATLPARFEVEGQLLDAERKPQEAAAAYARAMELGSTNFFPYFRWAALTFRPNLPADVAARVEQSLDKSATLNGHFAPAYALSATVKTQSGRSSDALASLARAASIEPGQIQYRLSLTRLLISMSQWDDARKQAQNALDLATSDEERRTAQQLIDSIARSSPPPR